MARIGGMPSIHGVSSVAARVRHSGGTTWLNIHAKSEAGLVEVTLFPASDSPEALAYFNRLAAAINAVPLMVAPAEQEAA